VDGGPGTVLKYIYIYTHTYMHTHTHVHACARMCVCVRCTWTCNVLQVGSEMFHSPCMLNICFVLTGDEKLW
jgi:hypothetical protein